MIGVNFFLPSGTKLHTTGFPTCAKPTLEQFGPVEVLQGLGGRPGRLRPTGS